MTDVIHKSGKRKTAVARATLKEGDGTVTINNFSLDQFQPRMYRLKIKEPILLAEDVADDVDIEVNVQGGGVNSQAEASRLAIARCLAAHEPELEQVFDDYDRHLLVADVRRKEASKPNRAGQARAKVQKSYR
jgi:small subunit ribosomal protein S9